MFSFGESAGPQTMRDKRVRALCLIPRLPLLAVEGLWLHLLLLLEDNMSTIMLFLIKCSNKEHKIMKLNGKENCVAEGFQKGMFCRSRFCFASESKDIVVLLSPEGCHLGASRAHQQGRSRRQLPDAVAARETLKRSQTVPEQPVRTGRPVAIQTLTLVCDSVLRHVQLSTYTLWMFSPPLTTQNIFCLLDAVIFIGVHLALHYMWQTRSSAIQPNLFCLYLCYRLNILFKGTCNNFKPIWLQ